MKHAAFIFSAEPLGDAKISDHCHHELMALGEAIRCKVGRVIKKQLRLYRVPMHEKKAMHYNQYALIAYHGELSDCLLEITSHDNAQHVKWPKKNDIEMGKRLTIEVVDWVDAYLLIEQLMREVS